jgi:hypothetical protein
MANTNKTQSPGHTYNIHRIPFNVWNAIVAEAARRGISCRVVILEALVRYVEWLKEQTK